MKTKSANVELSNHCLTKNEAKMVSAIKEFQAHHTSHLQNLMMQAGFSKSEQDENCTTYQKFKHMTLLSSYMKLFEYKEDISEEEQKYWDWLEDESHNVDWEDSKLSKALNSFENGLPEHLQKIMIDAGFEESEKEENKESYISFLSNVLKAETESLVSYKSATSENNVSRKK